MKRKVVVLGGYGKVGRAISAALAADPLVDCVVAGRDEVRAAQCARALKTLSLRLDARDGAALDRVLSDVFAVVNAAGPFQKRDYFVAQACAARGVHYVDLADSRDYVLGIASLNRAAQRGAALIVSGAGIAPVISGALTDYLAKDFDRVDEIHVGVTHSRARRRGDTCVRAFLGTIGSPMQVFEKGHWRPAYGWTESERVRFPRPLGARRLYLYDAADLALFPERYGAHTVTFRTDAPLANVKLGLSLIGGLRRRGRLTDPARFAHLMMASSALARRRNAVAYALRVSVRGTFGDAPRERHAYLIARAGDERVSVTPAVALIRKWVKQGLVEAGARPALGLLDWDEIRAALNGDDVVLVLA